MTITKNADGANLTIAVEGRIDTTTAPELEASFKESSAGITNIVLDMKAVEYISSAGLRVLLSMQKAMNAASGAMKVINVSEDVMEVFDVTGFVDILTIE